MAWEAAILLWVQEHLRCESLDPLLCAFTHLGDSGTLFIALGLLLVCIPKTRKLGAAVLTALVFGALVTNLALKPLVNRTRPWVAIEGLRALVDSGAGDPSFPSGHTTAAFAFAGTVLRFGVRRGWKGACLALAVLMALSRLYVGVHYPTDVLAGVVIGLAAGRLAWWLWEKNFMR